MQAQLQALFPRQSSSLLRNQQQQMTRQTLADEATLTYGPALAKLKTEAEKIRKWKTATQFELKRKESQLSEARQQLGTVQDEVTRVRVREEALKTQLQDQLSSYTEIHHKILVTRGLCSTLKEKVEGAEVTLSKSQADQNENRDLDSLRLEQYRALASKFRELEQDQQRVQSSLEEALVSERERGRGLEGELTNEREKNELMKDEIQRLQNQLQMTTAECEGVSVKLRDVERRLGEEVTVREAAESLCGDLQSQLKTSQEQCVSFQLTISSLQQKVYEQQAEQKAAEVKLQEIVREAEKQQRNMEVRVQEQQQTLQHTQTELETAVRERENLEIALAALREELCAVEHSRHDDMAQVRLQMKEKDEVHSAEVSSLTSQLATSQNTLSSLQTHMREVEAGLAEKEQEISALTHSLTERETANAGVLCEVARLKELVAEMERVDERQKQERETEKEEADTLISSLTAQLEALQTQLDQSKKTDSERMNQFEIEKQVLEKELSGVKQRLTETEGERDTVQRECERVRQECVEKVRGYQEETERARDTQMREKESFDTQVTELCRMLEQYRNENERIVQQKELQIQNLQTSLSQSREHQEKMEEIVRGAQGEVEGLSQQLAQLRTELREREEEVALRENQVREKDEEMAGLLKAVDTLRQKKKSSANSIPQSTTHTPHPTPPSPTALSPHTPLVTPAAGLATPLRPPMVKKPRNNEGEGPGGVVRYTPTTDHEDVLFKKPRPLAARCQTPSMRTPRTGGPPHSGTPRSAGPPGDECSSSVGEVSSTGSTPLVKSGRRRPTPSRLPAGKGRKLVSGEKKIRKPAAGTAWFDLDAVFGFGPED